MSYSHFASDAPARRLESIIKDDDPCSGSNVYQNIDTTTGDFMKASKSYMKSQSSPVFQTFSALQGNPAVQTGTITGVVQLILPCHMFTQWNGRPGFVQTFIVVNTLAQTLYSDVWCYNIVAWNDQAKNLNIEMNRVYRFAHFKMKSVKENSDHPGQGDYAVHLTALSTITEVESI